MSGDCPRTGVYMSEKGCQEPGHSQEVRVRTYDYTSNVAHHFTESWVRNMFQE